MINLKVSAIAAGFALAALAPQFAAAQEAIATVEGQTDATLVQIDQESIAAITAACGSGDQAQCLAVMQSVIATLGAVNVGISPEVLLGAVTAELAVVSNTAVATGNTAVVAAMAAATTQLVEVARATGVSDRVVAAIATVAAAVTRGEIAETRVIAQATETNIVVETPPTSNASAV